MTAREQEREAAPREEVPEEPHNMTDPGWSNTNASRHEVGPPPTLTALDPSTAVLGAPSFTLSVQGTGFLDGAVIVFAGQDEPTTVVSPTEVTTGVDMSVWAGSDALPVLVRNPDGQVSGALTFTFTAAAGRR